MMTTLQHMEQSARRLLVDIQKLLISEQHGLDANSETLKEIRLLAAGIQTASYRTNQVKK